MKAWNGKLWDEHMEFHDYARSILDDARVDLKVNPLGLLMDDAMKRALDEAHLTNLRGGAQSEQQRTLRAGANADMRPATPPFKVIDGGRNGDKR